MTLSSYGGNILAAAQKEPDSKVWGKNEFGIKLKFNH